MEQTMKTNTILSLFAATALLSFSTLSMAKHQNSVFDTDGDGTTTTAEITAAKTTYFNTADVDDSATLTLAEFANMQTAMKADTLSAAFTSADTDLSSSISLAEFTVNDTNADKVSYKTNVFTLADANSDAALSLTEYTDLRSKGSNSGIMGFARLDTDYDQLLTLEEVTVVTRHGSKGGSRQSGGRR